MAKNNNQNPDNETTFEQHFCEQLNLDTRYRLKRDSEITIDKEVCIYFDDLEEFLLNTQGDKLKQYQSMFGMDWKKFFKEKFYQALAEKAFFELLQDGITLSDGFHFDLLYFKPSRDSNKDQTALYSCSRWYFDGELVAMTQIGIEYLVCRVKLTVRVDYR